MGSILLVLAAGMGSRYGGIKQIDAVGENGECLLDYSVFDARRAGFSKVVFVIRPDIEQDFRARLFDRIASHFDAEYVFQTLGSLLSFEEAEAARGRKKPWGTVHAVLCAAEKLTSPFAVINSDDYYGPGAFATLATHLNSVDPASGDHAMAGYVLSNTMSRNGTVSRGICSVKDGYLESVEEHKNIGWRGDSIVSETAGADVLLSGDECVSMNFFGFTPKALASFQKHWDTFTRTQLKDDKAEALLPSAVDEIIKNAEGTVRVYPCSEKWFGMTYPEDKASVKAAIADKVASGCYPPRLWESS